MEFMDKKKNIDRIVGLILFSIGWIMCIYSIYKLLKIVILLFGGYTYFALTFKFFTYRIIIYIVIFIVGRIIVRIGRYKISMVKDYNMFFPILSADPTHSIANLAASSNLPTSLANNLVNKNNYVQEKLIILINAEYFPKGTYIDSNTNSVVFPGEASRNTMSGSADDGENLTVVCKGCGATNKIVKDSAGECEYCGSPI